MGYHIYVGPKIIPVEFETRLILHVINYFDSKDDIFPYNKVYILSVIEVCSVEYGDFHDRMVSVIDNGRVKYGCRKKEFEMEEVCLDSNIALAKDTGSEQFDLSDFHYESAWFMQFSILIMRMWTQMWRDRVSLKIF